ncbi:transporter substrate-binding domain-containing protein [Pseudomonas sp. GOM6]|uniref:substrate-binding periplasmic protein n=1 Tax=Pseudomonas sp. GOM6 TaxID=3036944 RepID=UPI0024099559|nr:transporter substrate-binding domain-containing protein [Pseudomonas sp. GOM6]MDG1579762.1 transporter substrate-binding domain-containing protein [Pseudomonas sp. GOM6]
MAMHGARWRWLGCLFAFCLSGVSQGDTLQLYTEEYPPMNFAREGRPTGMAVDLVRELLARTGDGARIHLVPWARAYREAQGEAGHGVFVTMRTAEREKLFKWVGPVAVVITSFYALKGSGIRVENLEQAGKLGSIAVPRQWYSYQELRARGLNNLYAVSGPQQMMDMLRHRRVPVVVADNVTLESLLALGGLRLEEVEPLYGFLRSEAYIAFSPATDDRLIAQWQQALDSMKADGSFALIYRRWLPGSDLPPGLITLPGESSLAH